MTVAIVPSGAPVGAEVRGLDLRTDPPGDAIMALHRAFAEHMVLIFRDQQLEQNRLLEISEWFGSRYVAPPDLPVLGDATQPAVVPVSNVVPGGVLGNSELAAHSDLQYMPVPLLGAMLYAVEVPEVGGCTFWSNLYQAYDELDRETTERIRDVRCWFINPYGGKHAIRSIAGPNQKYVDEELPRFPHPIARTHPVTGRKSLYMSWLAGGIEGPINEVEAKELLERLRKHVDQPHLYYRHEWRPGDVVLWDNRCTNHKREAFDASARRVMYRVQIAGTRPF